MVMQIRFERLAVPSYSFRLREDLAPGSQGDLALNSSTLVSRLQTFLIIFQIRDAWNGRKLVNSNFIKFSTIKQSDSSLEAVQIASSYTPWKVHITYLFLILCEHPVKSNSHSPFQLKFNFIHFSIFKQNDFSLLTPYRVSTKIQFLCTLKSPLGGISIMKFNLSEHCQITDKINVNLNRRSVYTFWHHCHFLTAGNYRLCSRICRTVPL